MSNIKWTYELVKEYVENLGYELISERYMGNKEKLIFKDKDGYIYSVSLNNLLHQKDNYLKFSTYNLYTIENIKLWLKLNDKNFELISEKYAGFDKKIIIKDFENYYYEISTGNLLAGQTPDKFNTSNSYTIQNIKLWCVLNNKPFKLLSETYEGNNKYLIWLCLKENCGEIFECSLNPILRNGGCGMCHGKQVGLSNCLATKNPELAKEWHPTKNGDLTPYDVTASSRIEVYWKCLKCGYTWRRKIATRNSGCGCPECNESHGEKLVSKLLKLYNVKFEPQKEFKGLLGLGRGNLSYDFYLPDYNLLIEYQGEYHDGTARNQAKKDFKKQQEHDNRKKQYAENNNIKLLEIWYYNFNNIEEILNKELNLNVNKPIAI